MAIAMTLWPLENMAKVHGGKQPPKPPHMAGPAHPANFPRSASFLKPAPSLQSKGISQRSRQKTEIDAPDEGSNPRTISTPGAKGTASHEKSSRRNEYQDRRRRDRYEFKEERKRER
jgi:hypothetical protein